MKKGIDSGFFTIITTVFLACCTLPARAATVGVALFSLDPNPVYVKQGDAVYWVEDDPDFGPYIISGPWGTFATPGGVQFPNVGTFNYSASSVFGGNWSGQVVVTPNSLPTVTITTPTNNSVFTAPATFAFEAEAFDPDPDDVWDVEFWVGNTMVDDVYSAPYATTVTNLSAGTYTLKAIVWDYSFAKATNSVTIQVGNLGPITLSPTRVANGKFEFKASGVTAGQSLVLQSSTNLNSAANWVPVVTNVATGPTVSFTNTITVGPHFFRVFKQP